MSTAVDAHAGDVEERIASLRRGLEGIMGVPATEGNSVEALRNGCQIFPAMLDSIAAAKRTVDLLTFVYWRGEIGRKFAQALSVSARSGVRVRVLLDGWGAKSIEKALLDEMSEAGVQVRWFRRLTRLQVSKANHRTHRKVLVVDEEIAFTGGVGIADEWGGDARNEREWRDTHFRIRGPAVDGLRAAFLSSWAEGDDALFDAKIDRFPDQPQPGPTIIQCIRGASTTGWSDVSTLFRALLQLAQQRVRITTAYFVPDDRLNDQLRAAAERGVRVEVLLPGPHIDKRFVQLAGESSYDALLESGIRIWHFQPSMLHAKIMTVDGVAANIGSANLNARSAKLDEEINLVAWDPGLVSVLDAHFDEDIKRSVEITAGRWEQRSMPQRALERAAGLLRDET
jgi:cardiolipin synthase A/B